MLERSQEPAFTWLSASIPFRSSFLFSDTSFVMQPERICGDEYSIRSDVWSTGISLLELVQNKFPFPNDLPPIELMMHITTGDVSDLPSLFTLTIS